MATLTDRMVAVIGTPQRGEMPRPPQKASTPVDNEGGDDAGSEISPEAFGIATPPRDPGPAASEAGGPALGDALSNALAQLAAANATISDLNAQLGAARAELAMRSEMQGLAVKNAALEAKHESQAEIGLLRAERQSLQDRVAHLEAEWMQWSGPEAHQPVSRDAP